MDIIEFVSAWFLPKTRHQASSFPQTELWNENLPFRKISSKEFPKNETQLEKMLRIVLDNTLIKKIVLCSIRKHVASWLQPSAGNSSFAFLIKYHHLAQYKSPEMD